jgi:radical SAM superfamily enzyme YgiQ (UPF0313 family)
MSHKSSPENKKNPGIPIVLTASRVEMSDFDLDPFLAFGAGLPLGFIPKSVLRKSIYPPLEENEDGTVKFAPYGLRKVEALLMKEFGQENVVTVHPSRLDQFIGPRTNVIGITSMDPLGQGFVSRTLSGIMGLHGKPTTRMEFEALLFSDILKKSGARILVGGSGAWQLVERGLSDFCRFDTVIVGEAERAVLDVFKRAFNGENIERVIQMPFPNIEQIPTINNASIYGTVEITRGCDRGCHFCSPTMRKSISFPIEHIMEEVSLNASLGSKMIILQTDDLFLYQSNPDFRPNRRAVVDLIQRVAKTDGVKYCQIAHMSLPPAILDREIVREIGPILAEKSTWEYQGKRCASVEIGIETGSIRLVRKYMHGKSLPFSPDDWPDIIVQAISILNDCQINPLATLVLGLPGETEEDIHQTLKLLDRLKNAKLFYVPLLFVSEEGTVLDGFEHMNIKNLNRLHWEIMATCWRQNIERWEPALLRLVRMVCVLSCRIRTRALLSMYAISKSLERHGGKRS